MRRSWFEEGANATPAAYVIEKGFCGVNFKTAHQMICWLGTHLTWPQHSGMNKRGLGIWREIWSLCK